MNPIAPPFYSTPFIYLFYFYFKFKEKIFIYSFIKITKKNLMEILKLYQHLSQILIPKQ